MQSTRDAIGHITPALWQVANQLHLQKIISEFAHEGLIVPELIAGHYGWSHYKLTPPTTSAVVYTFEARVLAMNHWHLKRGTVQKTIHGENVQPESLHFILEFQALLGIEQTLLPSYLEEITSTLHGSMFMLEHHTLTAEQLVTADYQTLEHAMFNGHPVFVANNGRIGFDMADYRKYAPEADVPVKLIWLAGHRSHAAYHAVDELSYDTLLARELGADVVAAFNQQLIDLDLSPDAYVFIPVHPWQWHNKLAILFAPDIATRQLVLLGEGPDDYFVQQSLRTLYNISHPEKFYTKTALSVLNMGFVRGMSPYYMDTTPTITTWIRETIGKDPYINSFGFTMLCEVATVGYRNFYYEGFGRSSAYNKMLSALWRESPARVIQEGQQLMTMAALLHIDATGHALLPAIINASGMPAEAWLKQYLRIYMKPLLHSFYQYDLSFVPHGENVILVLADHVPVKIIIKDITEEITVFGEKSALPEKARRIHLDFPEDIRLLNIFIDIFDNFFRFLTAIMADSNTLKQVDFWALVADCIYQYQAENPHLQEKFGRMDLFVPDFTRSCLNRLQLRNNKQMLDTADPLASLQFVGKLNNPIYPYRVANRYAVETLSTTP